MLDQVRSSDTIAWENLDANISHIQSVDDEWKKIFQYSQVTIITKDLSKSRSVTELFYQIKEKYSLFSK